MRDLLRRHNVGYPRREIDTAAALPPVTEPDPAEEERRRRDRVRVEAHLRRLEADVGLRSRVIHSDRR